MKFELSRFYELEGKTYDISYAIDKYIESDRYKHGVNYGEIYPTINERDPEDWMTVHRDLGENRIFKFENITKEGDKYFVEINHPTAIELLQSGDCKFSKRSFVDMSSDDNIPKFEIITLDIVLNDVELLKHTTEVEYKLTKVKEGTWFDNNVKIKYYSIYDKNIIGYDYIDCKEFVILMINNKEVYRGELQSLLYGGIIEPDVFKWFLMYLNEKGEEIVTDYDMVLKMYTDHDIRWWRTPESCFKSVYEYKGLELVNNKYNTTNEFNLEVFTTESKYTQYFVIYSDENKGVIEYFNQFKHVLDYIRDNYKISLQEYNKIVKDIKDLDLKNMEENKINITSYLKLYVDNLIEKLTECVEALPDQDTGIVHKSSKNLDTDLIFYFKNNAVNTFKVLGEVEEYEKCVYIGVPNSNYENHILVSEDLSKIFVEIPRYKILKDKFDINVVYNEESCDMLGSDNEFSLDKCKKMFKPLYDKEGKRLYVCVNVKDENILGILPNKVMDYINVKYGKYLNNIEDICKQFLDNVEKNTKIFNSIDRQELGEYFGLHFDGSLEIHEDEMQILDELIKVRKYLLNK